LLLPRSPDDSSSPVYPPDVSPAGCAASVLGGDTLRHESLDPQRIRRYVFRSVFRVFILVKIDPIKETRLMFSMTDLPLLGFLLLMV
jgi:hypothetical protein